MLVDKFTVDTDRVQVTNDSIVSTYEYQSTAVQRGGDGGWVVKPTTTEYQFKTNTTVPKLGCVVAPYWHARSQFVVSCMHMWLPNMCMCVGG